MLAGCRLSHRQKGEVNGFESMRDRGSVHKSSGQKSEIQELYVLFWILKLTDHVIVGQSQFL